MAYLKNLFSTKRTPQSEPIPGSTQETNSAGGYSFAVDDWVRLERFLVLGGEGGSYYATERALTLANAKGVQRCIHADGPRTVARILEVSEAGRAPKNDPAIFALAIAASLGDDATRRAALVALPRVCRIGTHLFHFAAYVDGMRGWGRGLRAAIARWYENQEAGKLAYQAVKYQARDGWSHRDLLRLAHPKPQTESRKTVYHWITQGWPGVGDAPHPDDALRLIWAFERAKRAASADEVARLIRAYGLPREAVPTQFLNEVSVWEALLEAPMPMTAMIRNLATMTRVGLLTPGSPATRMVAAQLTDEARLKSARIHPIAVLSALKTYTQGRGERSSNKWRPIGQIVDALDAAFYLAFQNVEPTGKRWLLALDVSGSMEGGVIAGVPGLSPRVASAAMAMVTAGVEENYQMAAFTAVGGGIGGRWGGGVSGLTPLSLTSRQRLDDVLQTVRSLPMGGTDCALPMVWALQNRLEVDAFVVYTDSETWHGSIHPVQALREYRDRMGIPAKLIVVGMLANAFSIADPSDAGMLDVVGFDTASPQLIADFAR
ncbi:MAG: TROVE domain-containing protein [Cytophagales bacterium]|nr:TROVE domain-containing protein [Armatimonadota bacterium]